MSWLSVPCIIVRKREPPAATLNDFHIPGQSDAVMCDPASIRAHCRSFHSSSVNVALEPMSVASSNPEPARDQLPETRHL